MILSYALEVEIVRFFDAVDLVCRNNPAWIGGLKKIFRCIHPSTLCHA
jgi:hypothetical protein